MATPLAASWRTIVKSRSHSAGDSADVGSSMIRMRADKRQRLGDLHQLLLADAQTADPSVRIELDAQPLQQLRGRATASSCDRAQSPAMRRLAAEKDVVGDGQLRNQVQFLVDDGDACRLGVADAARN